MKKSIVAIAIILCLASCKKDCYVCTTHTTTKTTTATTSSDKQSTVCDMTKNDKSDYEKSNSGSTTKYSGTLKSTVTYTTTCQ
jgi:hypothetical protein